MKLNIKAIKKLRKLPTLKQYSNSRFKAAKYRASKKKYIPIWSETSEIKTFYRNCPKGYDVDHIFPLQGVATRGLHVLRNLQYLESVENKKKKNNFEVLVEKLND